MKTKFRINLSIPSLAILLLTVFLITSCKQSPEQLFTKHYNSSVPKTEELIMEYAKVMINSRGDNSKDTTTMVFQGERITKQEFEILEKARVDTLLTGLKMFNNSKWDDAQKQLSKYVRRYMQPLDDYKRAEFYLAKASLNNEDYANALKHYNSFINTAGEDHENMDMAVWDYAICHLMADSGKAKKLFEDISGDNSSSYLDEAKAILAYL